MIFTNGRSRNGFQKIWIEKMQFLLNWRAEQIICNNIYH